MLVDDLIRMGILRETDKRASDTVVASGEPNPVILEREIAGDGTSLNDIIYGVDPSSPEGVRLKRKLEKLRVTDPELYKRIVSLS